MELRLGGRQARELHRRPDLHSLRRRRLHDTAPFTFLTMLRFAQFGAGRIGVIHAANLAAMNDTQLLYLVDVNVEAARALAERHGAQVADAQTVLADPKVDAVIIASSTDTHADLAIAAARAGKAIFCEKPIDLSLRRVDACVAAVKKAK